MVEKSEAIPQKLRSVERSTIAKQSVLLFYCYVLISVQNVNLLPNGSLTDISSVSQGVLSMCGPNLVFFS